MVSTDQQQAVLRCKVRQSLSELIDFYKQHMELCGWQLIAISDIVSAQVVITFKKPQKLCTVIIDSDHNVATLSLHVTPK